MGIIQVICNGVFVCVCKLYSNITKTSKSHAFVYDSYFAQNEMSGYCGVIIDNIYNAPVCVL